MLKALNAHAPLCVIYYMQHARFYVIFEMVQRNMNGMCSSEMAGKFRKYPSDVANELVAKKFDILQASLNIHCYRVFVSV